MAVPASLECDENNMEDDAATETTADSELTAVSLAAVAELSALASGSTLMDSGGFSKRGRTTGNWKKRRLSSEAWARVC